MLQRVSQGTRHSQRGFIGNVPASRQAGRLLDRTCAGGGVRLPEEAVAQLYTGDLGLPLELIARVTLEGDGVARLSAVAVAGAVLGHTWVVAGGGYRGCKDDTTTGHVSARGLHRLTHAGAWIGIVARLSTRRHV